MNSPIELRNQLPVIVFAIVLLLAGGGPEAQERLKVWNESGSDVPADYAEQLDKSLADFESNVALLGDHIVDCQGRLRRTEIRHPERSMDVPFHFVGVVDQSKHRVRWISRRETTDSQTSKQMLREFEIIDTGLELDQWTNGICDEHDTADKDRNKKLRGQFSHVVKFHPIPLSIIGTSGLHGPYDRNRIQLNIPNNEHLTKIRSIGGQLTAEWHIPSGDNYTRKEIVFDEKVGGMPKSCRVWVLLLDHDVEFLLHETTTQWKRLPDDVLVPTKIHMTTFVGGEKNPSKVAELVIQNEWQTAVKRPIVDAAFELVRTDADRPRWTKELAELLGEPQRSPFPSLHQAP